MPELTHYYECPHCGEEAFYLDHAPVNGEGITSAIAYRADGTCFADLPLKRIKCEACTLPLNMLLSREIYPL